MYTQIDKTEIKLQATPQSLQTDAATEIFVVKKGSNLSLVFRFEIILCGSFQKHVQLFDLEA